MVQRGISACNCNLRRPFLNSLAGIFDGVLALEILPPRIGLFCVAPDRAGAWDIRDVAKSEAEVPSIGGFRTLEVGHVDVWQRIGGYLTRDYGLYPRGRVNCAPRMTAICSCWIQSY